MSYVQDEAAVEAALAKTKLSTGGALPEPPPMGQAMLPMGTYAGKVVAITGGGGGLGRGFAREFARLGATVAILSRGEAHMARGKAVVEEVGGKAIIAKMDVAIPTILPPPSIRSSTRPGPWMSIFTMPPATFQVRPRI